MKFISALLAVPGDLGPPPSDIDSGIFAGSLTCPLIVLGVVVIAGLAVYVAKRRKR